MQPQDAFEDLGMKLEDSSGLGHLQRMDASSSSPWLFNGI